MKQRITRKLMVLTSFVALFFSASFAMASATNLKVGIVDLHKVLQESSQAKVISKRLEGQFKPRQEKLFTSQKQLKSDAEKLRRDATLMTAAQKTALQNKIMQEQRTLEQSGAKYQEDLNKAQNQAMQEFFGKVKIALDKIAKQNGYDMILQKENVPYSNPDMDITKQLVAALG
jgi:outer membrane protein